MGKLSVSEVGRVFKEKLAMDYSPVGIYYADKKPDGSTGFKKPGNGCIMPLIFSAAKGRTVSFDENSCGWNCSAFYLGYREWIFEGIEYYLSDGPLPGRECERFIKTPEQAKSFIKSQKFKEKSTGAALFKPLEEYSDSEEPELVLFFVNPDQVSALIMLLYFDCPEEDRVIAGFSSACGSVVTQPVQYARNGREKAVLGTFDISARARLPKNLLSLTFPYNMLIEMYKNINSSFLTTAKWEKIAGRD